MDCNNVTVILGEGTCCYEDEIAYYLKYTESLYWPSAYHVLSIICCLSYVAYHMLMKA